MDCITSKIEYPPKISSTQPNEYFNKKDTSSFLNSLPDQSKEISHPTPVRCLDIESLDFLEIQKVKFFSMRISKVNNDLLSPDKQYQSFNVSNKKSIEKKARILDAMCQKFDLNLNSNFKSKENITDKVSKISLLDEDLILEEAKPEDQAYNMLSGKYTQNISTSTIKLTKDLTCAQLIKEIHESESNKKKNQKKKQKLICNNNSIEKIDRCINPISHILEKAFDENLRQQDSFFELSKESGVTTKESYKTYHETGEMKEENYKVIIENMMNTNFDQIFEDNSIDQNTSWPYNSDTKK